MKPERIITEIESYFLKQSRQPLDSTNQTYFKGERYQALGIKTPIVRKASANFWKEVGKSDREAILKTCDRLVALGPEEYKTVAFDWAHRLRPSLSPNDFDRVEFWVKSHLTSWSDCDDLCTHALGDLLLRHPGLAKKVQPWTQSGNWIVRRAAAVSLIFGVRKGLFLKESLSVSSRLLTDKEELVLKGYGWLLKEASRHFPDEVLHFVRGNVRKIPRVAFRYAIEKYPKKLRQEALSWQ